MSVQFQKWAKTYIAKLKKSHSFRYDIERASFVGAKVWNSLSNSKECKSLEFFKSKIKKWTPDNCPCKTLKTYLHQKNFFLFNSFSIIGCFLIFQKLLYYYIFRNFLLTSLLSSTKVTSFFLKLYTTLYHLLIFCFWTCDI